MWGNRVIYPSLVFCVEYKSSAGQAPPKPTLKAPIGKILHKQRNN